jgi:hypothetical protein
VQCDSEVGVEGDVTSATCPGCGLDYQAMTCWSCDDAFVAVGTGQQVCPRCGAQSGFNPRRTVAFLHVKGELDHATSRVPPPSHDDTVTDDWGALPEPDPLGGGFLVGLLNVLAVVTIIVGVWLSIAVGHNRGQVHAGAGRTTEAVFGILLPTAVLAAILFALGHLIVRGMDLRLRIDHLERQVTRSSQALGEKL